MPLPASKVAGLQTSKYFNVAGMAILIFDYVITIGDEVQWVWGRSWDVTRIVFTASRYLPFVDAGMIAYSALRSSSEPCGPSVAENIIPTLGIVAAEALLVLRTYAFWEGDKRVLFGLLTYGVVALGAAVAISVTRTELIRGGPTLPGCLFISSRNSTFVYLFLLCFEMVIFFLTAYKHFRSYREMKTSIVYTMYRDGMFYIVCIILITFANMLIDAICPLQFSDLLDLPQISLHSVLASRIMFNLRKSSYQLQEGESTDQAMFSDIAYYSPSPPGLQSIGLESSGSGPRDVKSISDNGDIELVEFKSRSDSRISRV